jgi:hypothetical protein
MNVMLRDKKQKATPHQRGRFLCLESYFFSTRLEQGRDEHYIHRVAQDVGQTDYR